MEAIYAPFNLFIRTARSFPHTSGTRNDYLPDHIKNEVANGRKIPSLINAKDQPFSCNEEYGVRD